MASAAEPVNWKRNLFVAWVGCFFTGAAFSLVMPFLPLYVETLDSTWIPKKARPQPMSGMNVNPHHAFIAKEAA